MWLGVWKRAGAVSIYAGNTVSENIFQVELLWRVWAITKIFKKKILWKEHIYSTVGCHPTRVMEIETPKKFNIEGVNTSEEYINELKNLIIEDGNSNKPIVSCIGEIGLDYCRTNFASIEIQKKHFIRQLEMARDIDLPLYLHDRDTNNDFYNIMLEFADTTRKRGGVLHSFTGSLSYMKRIVEDLELHIGINGCSLKTNEGLEVAKNIPLNKLLLETGIYFIHI